MDISLVKKARAIASASLIEWQKKLSATDWKVELEKGGLKISRSNIFTEKRRPPVWKLECVVDEDPDKLLTLLKDVNMRRKWDKGFKDLKILETVDENLMIAHHMTKGGSVVSARDFIDVRTIEIQRKGDRLMHFKTVGTSIDLDKYNPDEGNDLLERNSDGSDRVKDRQGQDSAITYEPDRYQGVVAFICRKQSYNKHDERDGYEHDPFRQKRFLI